MNPATASTTARGRWGLMEVAASLLCAWVLVIRPSDDAEEIRWGLVVEGLAPREHN